jgi:hypothetical protein
MTTTGVPFLPACQGRESGSVVISGELGTTHLLCHHPRDLPGTLQLHCPLCNQGECLFLTLLTL